MGDANGLFRPVVGSNSILVLDGDEHLRHRRLMLPAFRRNHVARFEELITDAVERRAARWPLGGPFPIQPEMEAIAFETIVRDGARDRRRPEGRPPARALRPDDGPLRVAVHPAARFRRELGGLSPYGAADAGARRARRDRLRRDLRPPPLPPEALGDDLLSLLVQAHGADGTPMTDREIRDELVTMLMAGPGDDDVGAVLVFRAARPPPGGRRPPGRRDRARRRRLPGCGDQGGPAPASADPGDGPQAARAAAGRRVRVPRRLGADAEHLPRPPRAEPYGRPERSDPERFLEDPPPAHAWIPFGGGPAAAWGRTSPSSSSGSSCARCCPGSGSPRARRPASRSAASASPSRRGTAPLSPSRAFGRAARRRARASAAPLRLPPGPRLPASVQTLRLAADPVGFSRALPLPLRDAVTIDLLGFGRTVWVTDPELVKRVLASPEELSAGQANRVTEPIIGSESVINSDGDVHGERRRRLGPAASHGPRGPLRAPVRGRRRCASSRRGAGAASSASSRARPDHDGRDPARRDRRRGSRPRRLGRRRRPRRRGDGERRGARARFCAATPVRSAPAAGFGDRVARSTRCSTRRSARPVPLRSASAPACSGCSRLGRPDGGPLPDREIRDELVGRS